MTENFEVLRAEISRTHQLLAAASGELAALDEAVFALALREVVAKRALPICREALIHERAQHPALQQSLAQARADRIAREEEAARAADSSGGCGGCGG